MDEYGLLLLLTQQPKNLLKTHINGSLFILCRVSVVVTVWSMHLTCLFILFGLANRRNAAKNLQMNS